MQGKADTPHHISPRLKVAFSRSERIEILDYLARKRNGTSGGEVAKALGLTPRQAEYHLKVLHLADLVVQVEDQGQEADERYYVVANTASW